jgi:hypothetical protein
MAVLDARGGGPAFGYIRGLAELAYFIVYCLAVALGAG